MQLTKLAIERKVTIAMVIVALVVMGLVGLKGMPWDLFPNVDLPIITITVPYPGAGPQEVEQRILKPVEDAVSVINGVNEVSSTGYENIGNVTISFNYGIDIDVAASDVRDAVDRARAQFPDDADQASLYKIDIGAAPVIVFGVTGQRTPRDLRKLVEDDIATRLGQISGVASVNVSGGEEREIQVLAHKNRLDAVGLSISELAQKLVALNIDVPSGSIKEGTRDYAVRVLGQVTDIEEIRNLRIKTDKGGIIPLWSIADIQDGVVEPESYSRIDSTPAVTVSVVKQSNANTVFVVRETRKILHELISEIKDTAQSEENGKKEIKTKAVLPDDIKAVIAQDTSERVVESIKDVKDAILFGALLAAIVVFLFLHNLRGTLIVAIAIPAAIIATFLPVGMGFGFTLNMMVMLGLSLSIGVLVDDSIVVLENIERHLQRGEEPKAAAFNGRTEIAGAAVGITLVDVVIFIPIAMMGGIIGRIFNSFALTCFVITLLSLFMSFTLTPMLASWWYTRHNKKDEVKIGFFDGWDRGYEWLQVRYARFLHGAIRHPYWTVFIGYAVLITTLVIIGPRLGKEFSPSSDAGQVSMSIECAVGTRLEETDQIVREIEKRLSEKTKYPEIEHITASVGSQGGSGISGVGNSGGQYAGVDITMSRRRVRVKANQRSDQALVKDLRKDLADIPNARIKISGSSGMGPGGADVQMNILCEDQDQLGIASADLVQQLKQIPGLLDVDLSAKPGRPEIHARIDRIRAADYELSAAQIGSAVRTAFSGDTSSKFREGGEEYDIRVKLVEFDRTKVSDIANLFVGLSSEDQPVYLRDVADVSISTGPSRVERFNRQRKVTLSGSLDKKILMPGAAQQKIDEIVSQLKQPGVTVMWSGEMDSMRESFGFLVQALMLAVLLVYIVTAALYNSLLQPLNIMFTIPMALVGGLIGLYVTGNSLSIVAMIGIIQLTGLVGKNAILMVDYTNTLRARGLSKLDAVFEAGPTRMRPILMTTFAAIFSLIPTALAINEGSEWRAPMAIVVIFGLAVSTVLSLIVVPCTYLIWEGVGEFFGRMGRKLGGMITHHKPEDDDKSGSGALPPVPPVAPLPATSIPAPTATPVLTPPPVPPVADNPEATSEFETPPDISKPE